MTRTLRPRALLTGLLAALALPTAAHAAVSSTLITAPADGYAPVFNWLDGNGFGAIDVTGTVGSGATSSDKLDIVCLRRGEPLLATSGSAGRAAEGVPITVTGSGESQTRTFRVAIDATTPALRTPCRLRAIPAGTETGFDAASFPAGPAIFPSGLRDLREPTLANPNRGVLFNFDASTVTPGRTSTAHLESFGGCGLWDARPLDPSVGPDVSALNVFDCAGYADDVADEDTFTRSEVQLDARNAFTGAMAANGKGALPLVADRPPLTRTLERDPATGLLHTTESSDLVRCQSTPAGTYPFTTAAACGSFVPTGVRMSRESTMSADGRVTTMRDHWESTDGAAHVLDLMLEVDFASPRYGVQLPWTAPALAAYLPGAVLDGPPAVPASILVRSDRSVPAGDLARPTGAVTFSSAPATVEFGRFTTDPSPYMKLHYQRVIAAGAPVDLTHTFSMAPTAAESAALAAQAEDSYGSPSVAITGPAGGSTVTTPDITVTGTASDNRGVAALLVAGAPVAVGADGGWSRPLRLAPGANTILARATDGAGNVSEAAITVTYAPRGAAAPAKRCVVPILRGLRTPAAAVVPLRRAGCRLGRTLAIYSKPKRVRKGRRVVLVTVKRFAVLGSRQKAGTRLPPGTAVDVIVQARKPKRGGGKARPGATPANRKPTVKQPAAPKPPVYLPDLPAR